MYDELKEALLGCSAMTFSSAAEEFFMGERGRLTKLDPRQAAEKMLRLVCKLIQEAADMQEACEYVTVAALRSWMLPELKTYVDMSKQSELQPFLRIAEEWERSQPEGTLLFKKSVQPGQSKLYRQSQTPHTGVRKTMTCYHCGKVGHISRDCHTRLAAEKQATTPGTPHVPPPAPTPTLTTKTDKKPIVCFNCHQVGHKSLQCPKKVTNTSGESRYPLTV